MKTNTRLINQSDLLAIIVEKIIADFREDISLFICYGSFVTGEYGCMSDIDFFFVPKTERGIELDYQFIINNIGYDLWPVSWERLNSIASLEDQPASMFIDGITLFASSEDDEERLEDLKSKILHNLKDEVVIRKMSRKYLDKAKTIYFDMKNHTRDTLFIDAMQIVETLLVAISLMNGTYLRKGLKKIDIELKRFSLVPNMFLEKYRELIHAVDQIETLPVVKEMIAETDHMWKLKFENNKNHAEMVGFYEEFKSTYNKLLSACDEENYESAYYAGFMIDRETQSLLTHFAAPGMFPSIIDTVLIQNFESIKSICREHERKLVNLLEEKGVKIANYKNTCEFRRHFLKKTT